MSFIFLRIRRKGACRDGNLSPLRPIHAAARCAEYPTPFGHSCPARQNALRHVCRLSRSGDPDNVGVTSGRDVFVPSTQSVVATDDFLAALSDGDYFVKPADGECGAGIFRIRKSGVDFEMDDTPASVDEISARLRAERYLIQRTVEQHNVLSAIHPQSFQYNAPGDSARPIGRCRDCGLSVDTAGRHRRKLCRQYFPRRIGHRY